MKIYFVAGLGLSATCAYAVNFDFEGEASGFFGTPKTVSSGGVDLTLSSPQFVYIFPDSNFAGLGDHAVAGRQGTAFTALTHEFSVDILSATFLFGDGGGDNDGTVSLDLYDGADNYITTVSQFHGNSGSVGSITINQTFRKAVFTSLGGNSDNSLAQEWADVEAVPEPATMTLLGLGALAALRRKKRNA